jgi:glyoxylase-like metal-dependent hydrolase (beta-lactamase superfamily II)
MVAQFGASFTEPEKVDEMVDGTTLSIAGITLTAQHAPGHTQGSLVYTLTDSYEQRMLSGDVLFKGSIGRTDLPGGDHAAMLDSLERVIVPADDELIVHCGHGPDTTIGIEKRTNPYIRGLQTRSGS